MAWFETWFKNDLAKPINVVQLQGVMFNLDNLANKIGVELEYNGQPAALEGTIAGYVIRNDGTTLNLTTNTGKDGNKAWVILPQEAYTVEGPISIVIKLVYNSAETTIGACAGYVTRSRTSSEIAPTGTVIPSLASLEAAIAAANAAAANAADATDYIAPTEEESTASAAHAVGSYFIYNGKLMKATSAIAQGATIVPYASGVNYNCAEVAGGLSGDVHNLTNTANAAANNAADAQQLVAPVESMAGMPTGTATMPHATGSYFVFGGALYMATADIDTGDPIVTTGTGANAVQVPGGVTGEVTDLKSAFNALTSGMPIRNQIIEHTLMVSGNYNVNDTIGSPSTGQLTRSAYTKIIPLSLLENADFVFNSGSTRTIAFIGFDSTGKCVSTPVSWLSDGTYTKSQVISNAQITGDTAYFSFQITKASGSANPYADAYASLETVTYVTISPDSIADDSITETKLSSEVREKLNRIQPGPEPQEELLEESTLIYGSYKLNDDLGTPTDGGNTRESYSYGFELTDDLVFTADTNGLFKIAFVAFDANNKCISLPTVWLTDGTYTASQIKANAGSSSAAKYTFQIANQTSTAIGNQLSTLDYYSLKAQQTSGKTVDVIMFMGQSNMAGRGEVANAPTIINGAGYEYKAISDPDGLSIMQEPFGRYENKSGAINDGSSKTGSMVVAFTNAYYTYNGNVPVVGVSASEGGTSISDWQPNGARLNDAIDRLSSCVTYLESNDYVIRHKYILWCQGETDGDDGTTASDYKTGFDAMLDEMMDNGIEKLFLVRIGNYNSGSSTKYDVILNCQTEIAQTEKDVIMASTDFAGMRARNLMKDAFHYYQEAYNEVGTYSGINVAMYAQTGKEPTMYDTKDGSLYFSHKN